MPDLSTLVPVPNPLDESTWDLRADVRSFLAEARASGQFTPRVDAWLAGWDPAFSQALAARGWIGMTIPVEHGGHGHSPLDRYVVIEELLAAGAPVAAHWFSDRQIAPALLKHGTAHLQDRYLPGIVAGTCYFAIGLSEPDAGSDLAAVRTKATRVDGGWRLDGTKVWTSGAHECAAIVVLARSASVGDGPRHAGLSQFVVDLPAAGVTINPIRLLTGAHHFNEVVFDDVFVPDDQVLGGVGDGWSQVTSELAYERSGPERFLSTYPLLAEMAARGATDDEVGRALRPVVGALVARLWTLRQLSLAIAGALGKGEAPMVAAALVKDLGTTFEQDVVEAALAVLDTPADPTSDDPLARMLASATLHSPGFTIRGGTNEVLRGLIARSLELR